MGKGRNKNKEKDAYTGPRRVRNTSEDEYDSDDSSATHLTFDDDMRSTQGDQDIDEETILDSLSEHIENAANKNNSVRMAAMRHLHGALAKLYLPEFILKWKVTLLDMITKNIKKTDEDCALASTLLAQLALQIGEDMDDLVEEPLALLRSICTDESKSELLRSRVCLAIAITSHLCCADDVIFADNLKALRHCWANQKSNSNNTTLFSTALPCWALLLEGADQTALSAALSDYSKITTYLESPQVENRITTGESIAFIYEIMREGSSAVYRFPNHAQMIEILGRLASDSSKIKSKKARRVQRYSFRQIYSSIVDGDTPEVTIKFCRQTLLLDTCSSKLFYDLCCEVLHGGMMHHLESNELLREIFQLGPIPEKVEKVDKLARMAIHDANTKYRNQVRGKQRDKRSAVL